LLAKVKVAKSCPTLGLFHKVESGKGSCKKLFQTWFVSLQPEPQGKDYAKNLKKQGIKMVALATAKPDKFQTRKTDSQEPVFEEIPVQDAGSCENRCNSLHN
jgi:hypothetical protein